MALYVGKDCPVCQGSALFFRTASDGSAVHLYCPECNSAWFDIDHVNFESALFPNDQDEWNIPGTSLSIKGGLAHWSSVEELTKSGLSERIAGEYGEAEF